MKSIKSKNTSRTSTRSTKKSKRYYIKDINQWKKYMNEGDVEVYHGIEDTIFDKFIRDISKWSDLNIIQQIATQLKTEILDVDRRLWYA